MESFGSRSFEELVSINMATDKPSEVSRQLMVFADSMESLVENTDEEEAPADEVEDGSEWWHKKALPPDPRRYLDSQQKSHDSAMLAEELQKEKLKAAALEKQLEEKRAEELKVQQQHLMVERAQAQQRVNLEEQAKKLEEKERWHSARSLVTGMLEQRQDSLRQQLEAQQQESERLQKELQDAQQKKLQDDQQKELQDAQQHASTVPSSSEPAASFSSQPDASGSADTKQNCASERGPGVKVVTFSASGRYLIKTLKKELLDLL